MRSPHWPSRDRATPGRTPRAPRAERSGRSDIQGLRALAVGLVIAHHVLGAPVGGFVGVDVFFVLSGFLITHLLLSERAREGRTSYLDFYRRRVRRIVPAATVVLLVTVAATALIYSGTRGDQVARDGVWAFLFAANWHFAASGTDYFASGGPVSPLQHYWSLSVEEQFYVVWPTVLVVALLVAHRVRRRLPGLSGLSGPRGDRVVLGAVAGVLAVGSFAYSLVHSTQAPVAAYFSTFDRAWELLVGALLACTVPLWTRLPGRARTALAYLGLAGIAVAVVVVDEGVAFPAPWAVLPVAGAALVIVAGVGTEPRHLGVLRNRVTTYVGDLSFSLYLWHFPVVVLLPAYLPEGGAVFQVVALAMTVGLSVLSYHLVEQPVRQSAWLEPRQRKLLRRGAVDHSHRLANAWLAVGAVVLVVMVAAVVSPQRAPESELLSASPVPDVGVDADVDPVGEETDETGAEEADPGEGSAQAYLQERIRQSLGLTRFPVLSPPLADLGLPRWRDDMAAYGCVNVDRARAGDCQFGPDDAATTTVVLGDSIATAYMPAVRTALPTGRVQQLTLESCPALDVPTDRLDGGGAYPECDAFKPWAVRQVERLDPDLVLLSSSALYAEGALRSGVTGTEALDEIRAGLEREIAAVSAPGRIVAVVSSPPDGLDLTECFTTVGSPSDCRSPISQQWLSYADMQEETAEAAGAYYVDTRDWLCAEGQCPGFVGTTPATVDGTHLTLTYAEQLGPVMQEALVALVADARAPA